MARRATSCPARSSSRGWREATTRPSSTASSRRCVRRASRRRTRHGATVDFDAETIYQTYKIAEDAQPYREAAAAIRSLGLEVFARKSGGGTDGNFFNAKGIPCVALATGMVDEHATTEHIADRRHGHGLPDPRRHRHR